MYLYIDETGDFSSTGRVAGWLTQRTPEQVTEDLQYLVHKHTNPGAMAILDSIFHARDLRYRHLGLSWKGVIPLLNILNKEEAKSLLDSGIQYCKNSGKVLHVAGAWSQSKDLLVGQTRYIELLQRLLESVSNHLQTEKITTSFHVRILGRNPKFYELTERDSIPYSEAMSKEINSSGNLIRQVDSIKVIPPFSMPGLRNDISDEEAIASQMGDFAAWISRDTLNENLPSATGAKAITRADQILLASSEEAKASLIAAWLAAPDFGVKGCLDLADELMDARSSNTEAIGASFALYQGARKYLTANKSQMDPGISIPLWTRCIIGHLQGLNHTGAIQGQMTAVHDFIRQCPWSPEFVANETTSIQLHALNEFFNNFHFDDVLAVYPSIAEVTMRPEWGRLENDQKMRVLGSMGQANAFLGKHSVAQECFKYSLEIGAESKSMFRNMSVNYSATTYWEMGDAGQYLSAMQKNTADISRIDLSKCSSVPAMIDLMLSDDLNSEIVGENNWQFNMLNLLRGASLLGNSLSIDQIKRLQRILNRRGFVAVHPSGLLLKWFGYHLLKAKLSKVAMSAFNMSVMMNDSTDSGPTLEMIGLSTHGLQLSVTKEEEDIQDLLDRAETLSNTYPGFKATLARRNSDWKAQWRTDIEQGNIDNIVRWMPWSYA
jgi:hypothetical protein